MQMKEEHLSVSLVLMLNNNEETEEDIQDEYESIYWWRSNQHLRLY